MQGASSEDDDGEGLDNYASLPPDGGVSSIAWQAPGGCQTAHLPTATAGTCMLAMRPCCGGQKGRPIASCTLLRCIVELTACDELISRRQHSS